MPPAAHHAVTAFAPDLRAAAFGEHAFRTLPLAVIAGFAAVGLAWGPGWSERVAAWPWLLSLLVVGLPHGAADLAVARGRLAGGGLIGLAVAYVTLIAGAAAAFMLAPVATLAAFALLSGWHFGAAHAATQLPADGRAPPGLRELAAVARGGIVIGVPLAARPEATAEVVAATTRLAGSAFAVEPELVRALGWCSIVVSCLALGGEAYCSRGRAETSGRTRAAACDLAMLGLLGSTTDPLFAVGIFFLCWHGWRQMLPIAAALGSAAPHDARSLATAIAKIHLAAVPLLVPTWLALAALAWLLPEPRLEHSPRGVAILSLALYVVVTPAHDLLEAWRRSHDVSSSGTPAG